MFEVKVRVYDEKYEIIYNCIFWNKVMENTLFCDFCKNHPDRGNVKIEVLEKF